MYRIFEALDKLVTSIDKSRGIPMTENCIISRIDLLELIDVIKRSIPIELDDAQSIINIRDSILHKTKDQYKFALAESKTNSEIILGFSTKEAKSLLSEVKIHIDRELFKAYESSKRIICESRKEAEQLAILMKYEYETFIDKAKNEFKQLVSQGNLSYEKAIKGGIKEKQKLVSQNEIVLSAKLEATRLIEMAQIEAEKLQNECNIYIDNKLAEFESILDTILRSVNLGRNKLGKSPGYQ